MSPLGRILRGIGARNPKVGVDGTATSGNRGPRTTRDQKWLIVNGFLVHQDRLQRRSAHNGPAFPEKLEGIPPSGTTKVEGWGTRRIEWSKPCWREVHVYGYINLIRPPTFDSILPPLREFNLFPCHLSTPCTLDHPNCQPLTHTQTLSIPNTSLLQNARHRGSAPCHS